MDKSNRPLPCIHTERLTLQLPPRDAADRVLAFFHDNAEHLAPYDPPRPDGFLTPAFWHERLERIPVEFEQDIALRLVMTKRGDENGPILGMCNFSQIFRGPLQACVLGYSLDHRHVGRGLMAEALRPAIDYVFNELGLHRIEANYMPTNERSGRLLRRLGFVVEGYARDYLFIAGGWQDHVRTARTHVVPEAVRVDG